MSEEPDISRLLQLRKLTRAISAHVSEQLQSHLLTLSPLLHPRTVFGAHVRTGAQAVKGSDDALAELRELYGQAEKSRKFNLPRDLATPMDVFSATVAITPLEAIHSFDGERKITLISPLKWTLSYRGYGLRHLQKLIAGGASQQDVQTAVLHHLMLHVVLKRRVDLQRLLEDLRFPLQTESPESVAPLPVPTLAAPLPTVRPSDDVILQSTELSGTATFEEVIDEAGIDAIEDPLVKQIRTLAG